MGRHINDAWRVDGHCPGWPCHLRAASDPREDDEGRKRPQARGVKFGRKLKFTPFQIKEALARREIGETLADIGRSYGVSHSTISRL
jgi:hypothetical protein